MLWVTTALAARTRTQGTAQTMTQGVQPLMFVRQRALGAVLPENW